MAERKNTIKVKTKEMQPKIFALLFLNKEKDQQVIKLIVAYAFEDAVAIGRHWISESFGIPIKEAMQFIPSMYESVPAVSLIEHIVEGQEKVVSDNSVIMKKILEEDDPKKAHELIEKHKNVLTDASVKYLEEELKKKEK